MVGGSISFHTIAHLAMRYHKKRYEVTPQILHDRDTTKPLRQSRHNKSILSQNSVFQFLFFFLLVVTILLAFGSAKGKTESLYYVVLKMADLIRYSFQQSNSLQNIRKVDF